DRNTEITALRETLYETVFMRKLPNGVLADPEYQQYYSKYLGFLFWKWDRNFDRNYHIRPYFDSEHTSEGKLRITSENEFRQIIKTLTWAPFKAKTSPWECLLINNLQLNDPAPDEKATFPLSVLIFRMHHGLCDGFSILHALMQELGKISMKTAVKPHYARKSFWRQMVEICTFPVLAPYQFSKTMVDAYDVNDWHRGTQGTSSKPFNASFTHRIPTQLIKEVKDRHGVSFTAVVMSTIMGGIRNSMIRQGLKVPRKMSAAIPVPLPNHPHKLRNHWVFTFLKLPIGIEDPLKRLQKIEGNIMKLKHSLVPAFSFSIIPIVGATFPCLMKIFNKNSFSTILISNFPGPNISDDWGFFTTKEGRHNVIDMNFIAGMGSGNVGVGLFMLSYKDGVRIITEVDGSLLPDDTSVELLNEEILKEINYLRIAPGYV
ncbi:unnamed protein product, partial [Allacma fusca]